MKEEVLGTALQGKQAIIDKIIADANEKAESIITTAKNGAEKKKQDATEWANKYLATQEEMLKKEAEEIISRRSTVADLDVRKILLQAKQDVISKVLNNTLIKLKSLDKKTYLTFVEKLIEENCDEGDEVVLSKDNVLTEKDVSGLKVFTKKSLKTSVNGNFEGGVYLVGKTCDKDLTFDTLIKNEKDKYISKIAEILFKD